MEWIAPEHREIHEFLLNWGKWALTRPSYQHCGSAEHHYRSPQCWDERNPRPEEPNLKDALLIERQMRIVPKISRKILKFKYVYRADNHWIIQRLRLKNYDQNLYTARQIMLNLTRASVFPYTHGRFNNLSLSGITEIAA